ncbi:MAG: RNA polymerase sigma factor [Gemmataceae bacterium]
MCWLEVEELIRKAQAGDRAAFGELVKRFEGAVYASALAKVRNPHVAQELTQEVFVHAMRKIGQLRDPRCFAGWLRRITARMAINKLTRRGIAAGAPDALEGVAGAAADPLDAIVRTEERVAVRAALKRLKAIDRTALEAFYLKGQSLNEIADRFDVPLGTVKRRLHTARIRLKAALGERAFANA